MTRRTSTQCKIFALFSNHDELHAFSHLFNVFSNVELVTAGSSEFSALLTVPREAPALITLTSSLYPDAEPLLASRLKQLYPNAEILLLTLDSAPLPHLQPLARDRVRHLLVAPGDDKGDMDSIQGAIARLVAKHPWSLDNSVEMGTTVHEFSLQTAADKEILIAVLEQCIAGELPELELLRQRAALLADEMIENALYGAPQDEAGRKLYAKGDDRTVLEQENILFRFAFDGETLAMEITDGWGTLQPDLIVDFLARNQEADAVDELEGGGRGLFIIWRFMDHLHVDIRPGERTVLGGHLKAVTDFDPETPRSFFISTEF